MFSDTQPLVASVVDGYNVTIFAYGQTGSGKTHTMEGPPDDRGVNFRALAELFRLTADRGDDYEVEITVSLLEIYVGKVYDLLVDPPARGQERQALDVKLGDAKTGVYVKHLTEVPVTSVADVEQVIAVGSSNRTVANTNRNSDSSRSHALLRVLVRTVNRTTGVETVGKLTLIDLAGSERVANSGVQGQQLLEAQAINKSLSTLGTVIQALATKRAHVPFRDSTLTYLLQDSLGQSSKCLMFVQVNPTPEMSGESLCSLQFAARVARVELGEAKRNQSSSSSGGGGGNKEARLLRRIAELEAQLEDAD